jgi:two-component sensor histidine kinase
VAFGGPAVFLSPRVVQNLGLAIHELATNASKYGALSNSDGRISIGWHPVETESGPCLRITWRETDGPPVTNPKRRGFGAAIIQHVTAQAVNGSATLEFDRAGVIWTLDVPDAEFELIHEATDQGS